MSATGPGVVSCPQPLAAAAGGQVLEQGGNAVDAAIAVAYAQGVVDPLMCGLGGTASMLVLDGSTGEAQAIEGPSQAGSLARPDTYRLLSALASRDPRRRGFEGRAQPEVEGAAHYLGHAAVVVPTFVRVTADAHRRYGRLPWHQLLEPAIALAAEGFAVDPWLHRSLVHPALVSG